jgi:hypothetical protein
MTETISYTATLAAEVRKVRCRICRAAPGRPCSNDVGPHLSRWLAAYAARKITRDEVTPVIGGLVVATHRTIVPDPAPSASVS